MVRLCELLWIALTTLRSIDEVRAQRIELEAYGATHRTLALVNPPGNPYCAPVERMQRALKAWLDKQDCSTEAKLRATLARAEKEFDWTGWEKSLLLSRCYMSLQRAGAVRMPPESKVPSRLHSSDFDSVDSRITGASTASPRHVGFHNRLAAGAGSCGHHGN